MHLLWSDPSFVISTQLDLNRCFFNDSSLVISTQLGLNSYIECSLICHFYTTWFEQLYWVIILHLSFLHNLVWTVILMVPSFVISTQLGLNSYIEWSFICHFHTTWFEQVFFLMILHLSFLHSLVWTVILSDNTSFVISTQLGLNSYIECSFICHFYTTWFEQKIENRDDCYRSSQLKFKETNQNAQEVKMNAFNKD